MPITPAQQMLAEALFYTVCATCFTNGWDTTGRLEYPPDGIIQGDPVTNGIKAAYKQHRILQNFKYFHVL